MKANEVRIGNFVTIKALNKNEFLIVREIHCDGEILDSNYKIIFDTFNTNIESVKPIPLTEEWLIKFGFEKDEKSNTYCLLTAQDTCDFYMEIFMPHYGWKHIKIKYVHQLQNLYFALTNTELVLIN